MWAYAQFGHQPPPLLLAAVVSHTETAVATLQPGSLATLLAALQTLGCQLSAGLLTAAAEAAVAKIGTFAVGPLVDLLQVFKMVLFRTLVFLPTLYELYSTPEKVDIMQLFPPLVLYWMAQIDVASCTYASQ